MNDKIDFPKVIAKFDKILERGLCIGVGSPDKQMCIEAAITQALDLPFNDNPECVIPPIREFKIRLNDCPYWDSSQSRAKGLRDLGIAQIGSKGIVDNLEFAKKITEKTIKVLIPTFFREYYPNKWVELINDCELKGDYESIKNLGSAAYAAANAAANAAYDANTAYAAAGEKYLLLSASLALEVLRELKSPGCEWL